MRRRTPEVGTVQPQSEGRLTAASNRTRRAHNRLKPRHLAILQSYYECGHYGTVAQQYGITTQRVRQLLMRDDVMEARERYEREACIRLGISMYTLLQRALAVYDRAMSDDGYAPAAAIRALELVRGLTGLGAAPMSESPRVIVVPVASLSAEEWAAQVRQERERALLPGVVIEHQPDDTR